MKNTGETEEQVITPDINLYIELDEKIKAEILNQVEEWYAKFDLKEIEYNCIEFKMH